MIQSISFFEINDVVGAGTQTIVLPARKPGAKNVTGRLKGKFQGVIIP